jgi:hypothetical protein
VEESVEEGEGEKRVRATGGNCTKGKNMVSAPASRNLSLDQNVQRHILGQGFTLLGEEYSGG